MAVSEVRYTAVTNSKNSVLSGRIESVLSMKRTQALLDDLTAQAKVSPRLRMNYDLRNSASDGSQRMLKAIEPGSPLPIHRHRKSSETVVCLRGRLVEEFYDELSPGGPVIALTIPMANGTPSAPWNPALS